LVAWSWLDSGVIFLVGLAAGALNVLAGGGSFLTLPALIFLGLPPGIANATNRVGVLCQNLGAVLEFRRRAVDIPREGLWGIPPALLGSWVGVELALVVSDSAFQRWLAGFMLALAVWMFFARQPTVSGRSRSSRGPSLLLFAAGYFAVGLVGGFIQAGVGFLILALTTAAGLDLVRGNALKVLLIFLVTILSLAVFIRYGRIAWRPGLSLALGTTIGGLWGVRLTVLKGHEWLRKVVTVTMVLFAIKLWLEV